MTLAERFWPFVLRSPKCWIWTGRISVHGYGVFHTAISAHRFAWSLAYGKIPNGLGVLHHCDNPVCVKTAPDSKYPSGHLFLGTNADNNRDMWTKGRGARGEAHGVSKLTEAEVISIRAEYSKGGIGQRELGAKFGVSRGSVHLIVNGKSWVHLGCRKIDERAKRVAAASRRERDSHGHFFAKQKEVR